MNDQLKTELQRMGTGWFILKYALEQGIKIGTSINYGKSQKTRESAYERTRKDHGNMIRDLATTGFSNNVTAGDPVLSTAEIRRILEQLTSGVIGSPVSKPRQLQKPNNKQIVRKSSVVQKGIPHGADDEIGNYVKYADNVQDSEMVPGLIEYLEIEYEKILGFAYELINREKLLAIPELQRIPVVLSKKIPNDECYCIGDNTLARKVKKQIDRDGQEQITVSEKQIKDIIQIIDQFGWLNRFEFTDKVIGMYFHTGAPLEFDDYCKYQFEEDEGPYIEIYYKNISCESFDDYKAKLAQCLAHEFFHFIHDWLATGTFNNGSKEWANKAVKESLADFFSVMYLLYSYKHYVGDSPSLLALRQKKAEDSYNAWENRFDTSWPYAQALWYYHINNWLDFDPDFDNYLTNGSIDKFKDVLIESQNSMYNAYRILTT